jgi:hypothetical protein
MNRPTLSVVPPTGGAPPQFDPHAIPPLLAIPPAIVTVALPDGGQAQIPGVLWPQRDLWAESDRRTRNGRSPAIEVRRLTRKEANVLAGAWSPLGRESRPFGYHAFALFVKDEPIALASAGSTVSASVDAELGLHRRNVIELTRLCRSEAPAAAGSMRVMLRIWREFLATTYWPYYPETTKVALVTYQLPGSEGHIYRTDGWVRLRGCKPWGGPGTWQNGSRTGSHPDALWGYFLPGHRPGNLKEILARRRRERDELAERRARRGAAQPARRAA